MTFSRNDTQHNDTQNKRICYIHYYDTVIMLNVIMLGGVFTSMLDVVMLSVALHCYAECRRALQRL